MKRIKLFLISSLLILSSCSSYQNFQYITEEYEIPSKVFAATYDESWQAVLQIMQQFDIAVHNQEAGVIKTRWIDNTNDVNFSDSFGSRDAVKSAKFRLLVNVAKGFRGTREVTKVTVHKRQLVEQDFLQGWKEVPTDGIQEQTILYRMERIIAIDQKLKEIEQKKNQEIEASF